MSTDDQCFAVVEVNEGTEWYPVASFQDFNGNAIRTTAQPAAFGRDGENRPWPTNISSDTYAQFAAADYGSLRSWLTFAELDERLAEVKLGTYEAASSRYLRAVAAFMVRLPYDKVRLVFAFA